MPTTTFETVLDAFREAATSNRDLGDKFERLMAHYLLTDPQYADRLSNVWLWSEWPNRWGPDTGIDLVAQEGATGDYWAIQCKFFLASHTLQKANIDSFFTASGRRFATLDGDRGFVQRLIVSTTDKWGKHAEAALDEQGIPTLRLRFQDLAESPIDWAAFNLERVQDISLKPKKIPRPHQQDAIGAIRDGFEEYDRGKLIMACGTGKTFTALRVTEDLVPDGGLVLVLAPSISLVAQNLREWTAEAQTPIHAFVVCSDTKVGKDEEDIRARDLAYPATTDPKKLANAIQAARAAATSRRTVVFSTYQSIGVITRAQKLGLGAFDLIICDEAHRTTGLTLPNEDPSDFVAVHDNAKVRASKRLYMTATPRIYADASKTKADEKSATLYSMDDESTFGPELYRLNFGKALDQDLLTEYKVLIVAVDDALMAQVVNTYNSTFKLDDKTGVSVEFATRIIGSWKGLSKQGLMLLEEDGTEEAITDDMAPMRRAVAFSNSIKASKQTTEVFTQLAEVYAGAHVGEAGCMVQCDLDHVDGTMNALRRQEALNWLRQAPPDGECRILSNARCLSEGIDVPALDAVVFFDTRDSIVDIVQSVGRVMRKAEGKRYGYIILPVGIPSSKVPDYNAYIESNAQFKGIWKVLKALRAHDESLVDEAEFRRKIRVLTGGNGKKGDGGSGGEQIPIEFPAVPIDDLSNAVYAAIPRKLGDREYWSEWAKSIGLVAGRLIERISALIASNPQLAADFARFLKGLQDTLNPAVSRAEAVEMLAQHILTLPIFQALFAESDFPESNAVGKALQVIVKQLDAAAVASETEGLEKFYANVRERVSLAKSDKSKQDIIRNLYDTFFNNAFPRMAERLGIVYTPVPVVDFILRSADAALARHFGQRLASRDVQILDPFAGTGTFLVRLIQSGLIDAEALRHKFAHELHANEIILLAYYIATVNIETAYHAVTGEYRPFDGMILVDTFQMTEDGDLVDKVVLPENNARAERQLQQPIRVIVGNPPYSAQQDSQNDNNQNVAYPALDARIRETYAEKSGAANKKNLYDSYIRAIRWASDRIAEKGIVAFVTNGSFLDANNMDGLRKCLTAEFSQLYVFNLRGNQRTSGEQSRQEGGKIFGSGSRTPVAITILVKDPTQTAACHLHYYDIGDYLTRDEKFSRIEGFGSIASEGLDWQSLDPNADGDWINQRNPVFETFAPLGSKDAHENVVFSTYSLGVGTNRDAWVYNSSKATVYDNMSNMIDFYNKQVARYQKACQNTSNPPTVDDFVDTDPKKISWSSSLLPNVARGRQAFFNPTRSIQAIYRPYSKQWLYFDGMMNHRVGQWPVFFPSPEHENIVISAAGIGAIKAFSALATKTLPDLEMISKGQCFPLYWYEKPKESHQTAQGELAFDAGETPDEYGYIRREAITEWALKTFRDHYADDAISREDIFWYVYGILHSPEYKTRFASNLKKMLPRVPLAGDFWAFSKAGRELGRWHLDYETVEPWPVTEEPKRLVMEDNDYRVTKMTFGKKEGKADKSVIVYNGNLTLRDIPLGTYDYVVNGKSAIEWIMERYAVTVDKPSGIRNDPNAWSDDPRYIVDLLKRIVRVSIEGVRIVGGLPALNEST